MFLIDLSAEVNKITFNILKPLYRLLSWTYDFTLNLLTGNIFDGITSLIDSFYTLFAIFMLFRISIVLIQYIIQPDNINDKSMGAGKMVSRILISALLIVSAPYIFKLAHNLQYAIVNPDDGILYSILNVQYSDNIGSNQSLSSVEISGVSNACSVTQGSKFSASTLYSFLSFSGKSDNRYFNALTVILVPGSNCVGISSIESAASSLNSKIYDSNASVDFIVGTIAGIGLIVFLIVFVIDIVVRNLNLLVLESISSIAFICYVNPKDKVFNQWLQNYGKTYVSVFIKFIALSLAVLLIQYINNVLDVTNGFAKLFYIIGLLVFAKALPGFVSKIFGIEGSGSFKESAGILKKGLGLGAGLIGAAAVGGISKGVAAYQGVRGRDTNNGKGRALAHALGSGLLGAGKGGLMGAGAGWSGKGISSVNARSVKSAKNLGNNLASGGSFMGRMGSKVRSTFGVTTKGEKETAQIEASGNVVKQQSAMNSTANSEVAKDQQTITEMNSGDLGKTSLQKAKLKVRDLEQLRKRGAKAVSIAANKDSLSDMDIDEVQKRLAKGETLIGQDGKKIEQSAIANALGKGMQNMKISDQGRNLRSLSLDKAEALLKNGGHLYDAGGEITMDDINNARAAGSNSIYAQYHNETGLTDITDVIDSARGGDHYSTITKESALNRIREGQTLLGTDGKIITKEDVQKMSAGSSINISVEGSEARNISAEQAKEIVSRGGHLYDGNREITMEEINSGYVKEFNVNYHDAGNQNATVDVMIDGIADNVNSFKTKVSAAQSSGQDQISTTVNIGGVNIDTEVSTLDASSAIGVFEKRARLDMISGGKNADVNADVKNYIDRIFNDNNETYADVITEIQNFVGYTTDANGQTIVEFKEYTDQKTGKTYSKSDSVDAVKKIIDTQEQKMKKLEQSSQHKQNLSNDEYNKKE